MLLDVLLRLRLDRGRHGAGNGRRVAGSAPQVGVNVSLVAAGNGGEGVGGRRDSTVGEAMSRSRGAVLVSLGSGTTSVGLGGDVGVGDAAAVEHAKLILELGV